MQKDKNIPFKLSNQKTMNPFRLKDKEICRDILRIGFSIFEAEKLIKDKQEFDNLTIYVSLASFNNIQSTNIEEDLSKIFTGILDKEIQVNIKCASNLNYKKTRKNIKIIKYKSLCLFSGGVDSFVGLMESSKKYNWLSGIFIAHSDQTGVINIVNKIIEKRLKIEGVPCNTIHAPSIRPKKNKQGYSQLRGFLYILCAGAFSELVNADNIIITECGATMYQPKFGIYDSITHTTHPHIIHTAKKVVNLFRKKEVSFILPFEDMTKAEIIAYSKFSKYLPETHSCISARFRNHCGVCYGCVLRRLAAILVGIEDVTYATDIISDENIDDDNLINLIRFSYYFIFDRNNLPHYSLEKILQYKKVDLFKRQSLDILAAIYLLNKKGTTLTPRLKKAYSIYIKNINPNILESRIKKVLSKSKTPDFNKMIID